MEKTKIPKVFFIVLNFNGGDFLKKCLGSVYQSSYTNYEVIVIDNNSIDGSFESAKELFPRAHFIKNERNIGFGAGNNIGIRFALEKMADYIFLLNNDATIETNSLERLIRTAEADEKMGILSPIIYDRNGKVWFAGGEINWLAMKATHVFKILSDVPYETQYVSGCAMFIKKNVFREAGLFDEIFFLYYEDTDLSSRARKKGLKIKMIPSAKVYHLEKSEHDRKGKIYWLVISGIIFFKKNAPIFLQPWISFYLFLRKLKNRIDIMRGKNNLALTVQKAYKDYNKYKNERKY